MFPRRIIQQTVLREDYPYQKSPPLIGSDHHGGVNFASLEAKSMRVHSHPTQKSRSYNQLSPEDLDNALRCDVKPS
ncbi:uncharacterized protein Myo81F isoform X13 [Drosophila suzukii]|uniref:Uncharacterized protein Myo81F isoform X13 n=1 Tax=Drosophila suzukii TaxID=28584 RepID=A0ABM4TPI4_DROSZ